MPKFQLKPPPAPTHPSGLTEWARRVTEWFHRRDIEANRPAPQAVQLEHLMDTSQSAAEDGILMFDPAAGKVVASVGGAWVALH